MSKLNHFLREIGLCKQTVFVVDDNEFYSKTLKEFLGTRFPVMKIRTFATGEACLLELHQNPDVIIMDHLLNTKSAHAATGLSIIKIIKERHANAHIIFLSAQKNLDVFIEALSDYGCDYLKKDETAFLKVELLIKKGGQKNLNLNQFINTNSKSQ
jgi:DNA-binding NarL/FixJ family response regulator